MMSTSGREKWDKGGWQDGQELWDVFEAAVPLWRGKQELVDALKGLEREEREGKMGGCSMLRVETRVTGIGVQEAILWLREQPCRSYVCIVKGGAEKCNFSFRRRPHPEIIIN